MRNILIHIKDIDGTSYLMKWSSMCDAPLSVEKWEVQIYSTDPEIDRVIKYGTSYPNKRNARSVLYGNRAGKDETWLTLKQIVDYYCNQSLTELPTGFKPPTNVSCEEADAINNNWLNQNWIHLDSRSVTDETFADVLKYS